MAAWGLWLIASGLFVVGEMLTLAIVRLLFAGGALGGVAVALAGGAVAFQLIAFIAVPLAVSPLSGGRRRHPTNSTPAAARVDRLVGAPPSVTRAVDAAAGRIRMGADEWTARTSSAARLRRRRDVRSCSSTAGPRPRGRRRGGRPRAAYPDRARRRRVGTDPPTKKAPVEPALIALIVVALLLIFVLAKSLTIVPQAQAKVVERLGPTAARSDPDCPSSCPSSTACGDSTSASRSSLLPAAGDHRRQPAGWASTPSSTSRSPIPGWPCTASRTTSPAWSSSSTTTLRNVVGRLNLRAR